MNFRCPNRACNMEVRLSDRACGRCGQPLGFGTLLSLYFNGLWSWLKGAAHTRCPHCKKVIPMRSALCPECGKPVTLSAAVNATVSPSRHLFGEFIRGLSPEAKRGIRWAYVILSALAFWVLLSKVESVWNKDSITYAMIAVVYLAFLYLFFLWIVPRSLRAKVGRRIRMATKIGVIFNFFTLLLALL